MRRIMALLAVFLLFYPVLGDLPSKYNTYDISVNIQENNVVSEEIIITFPENADRFNYYIIHQVTDLKVSDNLTEIPCEWKYERAGTLISCDNFNSDLIRISFRYFGVITQTKEYTLFSDRYIISTPTDSFNLKVFLPKGYILSEQDGTITQPAYYPVSGVQKTDGRNIYIEWENTPKLGEVYDISVFYEPALRSDQFAVVFFTVLVIFAIVALFVFFRKQPRIKEYGLTEYEKKFLETLTKENKLSQRKIARKINLSKAQTSRIAKTLEKRGLIKRKRKGRHYEIILK